MILFKDNLEFPVGSFSRTVDVLLQSHYLPLNIIHLAFSSPLQQFYLVTEGQKLFLLFLPLVQNFIPQTYTLFSTKALSGYFLSLKCFLPFILPTAWHLLLVLLVTDLMPLSSRSYLRTRNFAFQQHVHVVAGATTQPGLRG